MIKFYLLLCLLIPTYSFSQITGIVFCKQTGAALSGVTIELVRNGKPTKIKTTTSQDGSFIISKPSAGVYQLWVSCAGYKFYSYEIVVYRQTPKQLLSPIELEQISEGKFATLLRHFKKVGIQVVANVVFAFTAIGLSIHT